MLQIRNELDEEEIQDISRLKEGTLISAKTVQMVFKGKALPFQANSDGSVDKDVYLQWLYGVGREALKVFDESSEVVAPTFKKISTEKFCAEANSINF